MFKLLRAFLGIFTLGMFWLVGLLGGVFLGALLMSNRGQTTWKRAERFGRKVVDLAKEEFAPGTTEPAATVETSPEFAASTYR
jgi:hypothetical protein